MLVRSEDTRCHRGFRPLAMSEKVCFTYSKAHFTNVQVKLQLSCGLYIISDMYISIEYPRACNSEPSFWTSCGEDVSSLSPARLRLSSATLLSGVRPFPRNPPSVELLMGAAPRAHKPYPQSSSTSFRADLRCAPPVFRFAPKGGRSPSACTCYPCPRRRMAQGLLVNNNRQ
jgi:hypothetical protein